jgi:hypothetical protein
MAENEKSERDTHFQGYAELFYPELSRLFYALHAYRVLREYEKADLVEQEIKEYLAQRAYDLAYHFVWEAMGGTPNAIKIIVADVPDLTAWPNTPSL